MADDLTELRVLYGDREVGRMREESGNIYFAYSMEWIANGFSISPRSLPLTDRVFRAKDNRFDGLFGVFSDSLPDGWGILTAIRALKRKGISYTELGPMTRLTLIGKDGLGALRYEPSDPMESADTKVDLDEMCGQCISILDDEDVEDIDRIFSMAGSTGGTRPKINLSMDGEEWMVKFRERRDAKDSGRIEYEYNLAAKECGIEVPEVRLLPSNECDGYFAAKRFDRDHGRRVHMITLGGLLEVPRTMPLLDYHTFLQATGFITQSQEEVVKAFRLACFNVLSGNRDDHSKNFAYLFSTAKGRYVLSPAYDLTPTPDIKEHEMSCMGEGNPGMEELRSLADAMNISRIRYERIIADVDATVRKRLSEWL